MTVSSGKLREMADELRAKAEKFGSHIEKIYTALKSDMNKYWQGSDYEEFIREMDSKKDEALAVKKMLINEAEELEEAARRADNI